MTRVCHISPVHDAMDNRVFYRTCCSLQRAGYQVYWVVQHDCAEQIEGVEIVPLRTTRSRWYRWLVSGWEAFFKSRRTQAEIYHFHDPEFIPQALLLRMLGAKVIYDIHEDYASSISQKFYIPRAVRLLLSKIAGRAEVIMSSFFHCVIAERYYAERFPAATKVLNYPRIDEDAATCGRSSTQLLYTGKVHLYRGALIHAKIPRLVPGTHVDFVGRCAPDLHARIQQENASHLDKLSFCGVGHNVPYQEIVRQYCEGEWLAGLAIFSPNAHLDRKELTKLFEYMLYGLPIITSNFPAWRRLVEENGCGICVDPSNEQEIADAVKRLRDDHALWKSMSVQGAKTARTKFSWESQEKTLLELYDQLGSAGAGSAIRGH